MDINRLKALNALDAVLRGGARTRTAIGKVLGGRERGLDRAFIMELVYGSVRYRMSLEAEIYPFLRHPGRTRPKTLVNLIMAMYQIRFMRVPVWAAINEAVALEKETGGSPGLVNAVLRNIVRRNPDAPAISDGTAPLSLAVSHPEWLVKRWRERFGEKGAEELARANNAVPPLTLRVNTLRCSHAEARKMLTSRGLGFSGSACCPDALILETTSFDDISGMMGSVFVQDEASQLVSILLNPAEGERILDACAAPGGKTTHIAQLTGDRAYIHAVEKDRRRIRMLMENLSLCGASSVSVTEEDILNHCPSSPYDRILLDAPCSALGVIRRNPDVKYRHEERDLRVLAQRQLAMLLHVAGLLRPGGLLVYSVCSTEPEETEGVLESFLNIREDFYIIDGIDDIPVDSDRRAKIADLVVEGGVIYTYPHRHNMDGFFVVRLGKK